jgi:hypothetical protein
MRQTTEGGADVKDITPISFGYIIGLVLPTLFSLCALAFWPTAIVMAAQQASEESESATAVCDFEDSNQIRVEYQSVSADHHEGPPIGKVWMPGGSAVALFTSTALAVGNAKIPSGAYTMYFIPGKKDWTLIVSKNAAVKANYDGKQDLLRAAMEKGTLSDPEEALKISLGHSGPRRCEMDVDYGKTKAWIEFKER